MRRIVLSVIVAIAGLLLMAGSAGCEQKIIASNARSSFSGFLTGMFSQAVNQSIN